MVCWLYSTKNPNYDTKNCENAYDLFANETFDEIIGGWTGFRSIYGWAGILGCLIVQPMADMIGRKRTMLWAGVVNTIAHTIFLVLRYMNLGYSANLAIMCTIRFASGVVSAWASVVGPLYLVEISPLIKKGQLGAGFAISGQASVTITAILGMSFALGDPDYWNFIFLGPLIFGAPVFLVNLYPESPVYFSAKNQYKEIEKSLKELFGDEWNTTITDVNLTEIRDKMGPKDDDDDDDDIDVDDNDDMIDTKSTNHFKEMLGLYKSAWNDEAVMSGLWISVFLQMFFNFCGLGVLLGSFTLNILSTIGLNYDVVQYIILGIGFIRIIFASVCSFLYEKIGRKKCLIIGFILCGLVLIAMTFLARVEGTPTGVVVGIAICIVLCTLSLALMMCIFFITGEMLPAEYKCIGQSVNTAVQFFGLGSVAILYPVLLRAMDEYAFLVFSGVSFLGAVYVWFYLPETRNRSSVQVMRKMSVKMVQRKDSLNNIRHSVRSAFQPRESVVTINSAE